MADCDIAGDCGSSGTRWIINRNGEFYPLVRAMNPEIIEVGKELAQKYHQNVLGIFNPLHGGSIELDNRYYLYGIAAKEQKADDSQLKTTKFELCLLKLLVAFGIAAFEFNLPSHTSFNTATALPKSEYGEKGLLEKLLRQAITSFTFCGTEMSFILEKFICLPEGAGVALQGIQPGSSLKEANFAVLMQGYRDVSILFLNKGRFNGISKNIGFHDLCKLVGEEIAFHDYQRIAEVICKAGSKLSNKHLQFLLPNPNTLYRNEKLAQIKKAIRRGRKDYLLSLSNWLKANLNQQLDQIIIAGGSAYYFRQDLEKLFERLSLYQLNWCDELEERIRSRFGTQMEQYSLHYRLTDVYGLFFYLHSQSNPKQRSLIN